MKRRLLLALTGAATIACGPTDAQKVPRVGFLTVGDPEPTWTLFRKAMAELGHVEGRSVTYEKRVGDAQKLAEYAAALVDAKVDVIVAVLTPAIIAARNATTTIPIVFNGGAPDAGLVKNFARPEGNLTGVAGGGVAVAGKSVQVFRDFKPTTKVIGVLLNAADPYHVPLRREIERVAEAHAFEVVPAMLKRGDEIAGACGEMVRRGVDAVMVQPTLPLETAAIEALKHRVPAISFRSEFVRLGGLMSYGPDQAAFMRLSAGQVDRVLKGARTADLPVQIANKFELIVNQRTARALGLTLPPLFLARADEVIE
jgi:putative tryptophan/tyrosine transport system substrate-binding protein